MLYPFLPAAELTDGVEAEVRDLAASLRPADVDLTEVVTARGFVAVGVDALEPVAAAFRANWPHLRPYGGRFGPRPPVHVTVALDAAEEEAERIAAQLAGLLPVRARAEALTLAEVTAEGWRLRLSSRSATRGAGDAEA
ncbi:2'-5' RNA ligase family protein [Streptomyces sp. M19]